MGRLLALDVGGVRTGIAVTDPLQITPNGLTTVQTKSLKAFLTDYLKQEKVEAFIIGKPTQMNGSDSQSMQKVREVMAMLAEIAPELPVKMVDERFTSKMAARTMLTGGLHKMQRRNKALVDQISATIILQSYMDSRDGGVSLPSVFPE
ncbi:MAG: Holliday junction resolvase RuvX [Paludibacteraceae bacterium]|nr:Holliday junction resolvase RuvX [Paludibacteraceae bacterium]